MPPELLIATLASVATSIGTALAVIYKFRTERPQAEATTDKITSETFKTDVETDHLRLDAFRKGYEQLERALAENYDKNQQIVELRQRVFDMEMRQTTLEGTIAELTKAKVADSETINAGAKIRQALEAEVAGQRELIARLQIQLDAANADNVRLSTKVKEGETSL